jgi:tyrosine-protein phosphatase YwqE
VRDFAIHLFRAGLVHNVASDAHDDDVRRAELRWGFERIEDELPGISEQAPWFTETAPTAIVSGVHVPAPPEPPAHKRAWLRMRRSA